MGHSLVPQTTASSSSSWLGSLAANQTDTHQVTFSSEGSTSVALYQENKVNDLSK